MAPSGLRWLRWVLGAAIVIAISAAALHFSEAEQIARLAERAKPWWMLLAVLLQCSTYAAQGAIWRRVAAAAQFELPLVEVYELSLAKLFVDQALPSAGIAGSAAVAKYLEQRGMARPAVIAGAVNNTISYFASYVGLLVLALVLLPLPASARPAVMFAAGAFAVASAGLIGFLLVMAGRSAVAVNAGILRLGFVRRLLDLFKGADPALVRSPRLLIYACAFQIAIVMLDAATVWVLVEALGATAPPVTVYSSFMISNLFRTIGVLPGGLGTFEASSVLTLQLVGVPLPAALSATLLFRGLSFWLPMIPGVWFSRKFFGARPATF